MRVKGRPYDCGMAADADGRTDTVGHSPTARVVQPLRDLPEERAGADGGLPGAIVHAEMLHVDHVDGNSSVNAAEA